MAVSQAQARDWAYQGFIQTMGRQPSLLEVQFLQGIAWLETQYGQGWKGAGVGSNNMGAVQAGRPPCNPDRSFLYQDSQPTSSGTNIPYQICFKKYPSQIDGMADVARIMYKNMHVDPTSIEAVSTQLYDHHYYGGFGKTREERIRHHISALTKALQLQTKALGESMPPATGGIGLGKASPASPLHSAPVYYLQLSAVPCSKDVLEVHKGMKDRIVAAIQHAVGAKVDYDWGDETETKVKEFLGIS